MAKIHLAYDDSATPTAGDVFVYVGPDGVVEPSSAASGGVRVEKNDAVVATRGGINFIEGSNVTLTVTDDAANDEVDVTIASSGSGGGDVAVQDDDVEVVAAASTLNFGTGLDVTDDGAGKVTIDATGGGGGSSSLQWQDWTPVIKNGSTTVSYDASTSKAKYLKVGPVTFFWFYLAIDAAGTSGAITIEGQPTELQDVHALSARRHIGSLEYADTGTKHSSHRIYAQSATSWQIYEYDNFATNNTALASGDHLEGYGSIHTSDDAVDIGGGGSGSSWIPWTESDVVTEVKGERVTLTTGETQTLLDITSDGVDFLGGHVIGSVGRLRITLDGTVVVDHITDGITGRGEDEAGDDIASFSIPAMQAESTLKIELNNMSGISRIYGWTLWHRPKTTGGGGGSGSSLTEEEVEDIVGAMVDPLDATPNTETLIAVTYDDPNGKLNFVVENDLSLYDNTTSGFYDQADVQGEIDTRVNKAFVDALNVDADTLDGQDSTDFASSTHTHTESDITDLDHYNSADFDTDFAGKTTDDLSEGVTNLYLTEERVEDFVGGMVTGNTETLIAVTYDDADGTLDFVVESDLALYDNTNAGFFDQADTQAEIDARVNKAFVDALNVDADTLDGLDSTDFSSSSHTHFLDDLEDVNTVTATPNDGDLLVWDEAQQVWVPGEPSASSHQHNLSQLSDVVINAPADNEILAFDNASGDWINQTAGEAGVAEAVHTHTESDITDLDHYNSTDFDADFAAKSIDGLSDVDTTTTPPAQGEALLWDDASSTWIPGAVESGSHSHSLDDLNDVIITTQTTGDLLRFDGTDWVNYPDSNFAQDVHTHTESDITDLDHYNSADFDADFATKTTDDLTEGSNLYHTSERVSDVVGGMVTGNTEFGVEVTYEDTDNTLDFSLKYNGFYNVPTGDDILTYQNTGQAGTSEFPARHDHSHKVNANVAPSSVAIGGANTRGSSSHLARANHVHAVDDDLSLYDNTTSNFQNLTEVQGEIDTRVDKAFVDALNVDADTLDGLDSTDFASSGHSHTLDDLSDVVITADATPADNEILAYDDASDTWINQTPAEAGLPYSVGQPSGKVAETDGSGGWNFIDTPGGGSAEHPHVDNIELSDGTEVKWQISLEADNSISFNFVGT